MGSFLMHLQKFAPRHAISRFMGWLANIQNPDAKNWMIKRFIRKYNVDMTQAVEENPEKYIDFNHFFTRKLKPELRPIVSGKNEIASPVDGVIAQMGKVKQNQLLQAKDFYYDLDSLLGDKTFAQQFVDGSFATLYLAPRDYHRVHMPLAGTLIKSIYIPGDLFSVNRLSSEIIPQLFTRNERLVLFFQTDAGVMAVVLIGAIIVGNIQTVWMQKPVRASQIKIETPANIHLQTGDELGQFLLGSTVIVLFGKDKMRWVDRTEDAVKMGELVGEVSTDNYLPT